MDPVRSSADVAKAAAAEAAAAAAAAAVAVVEAPAAEDFLEGGV